MVGLYNKGMINVAKIFSRQIPLKSALLNINIPGLAFMYISFLCLVFQYMLHEVFDIPKLLKYSAPSPLLRIFNTINAH